MDHFEYSEYLSNCDLSRHSVHWDSAAHASSGLETLDFPPRKKTWPPDGSRLDIDDEVDVDGDDNDEREDDDAGGIRKKTWPPVRSRLVIIMVVMMMVVLIMILVQPGWMILIPFGNDSCITRDLLLSRFLAERAAYGMTKQVSWPLAFFLLVGKEIIH